MLAWFRIYVNPCIPGEIRVKTLQNLICLSSKHLGVLKNLFKHVCAFQINLEFASVVVRGEGKTGVPGEKTSRRTGENQTKSLEQRLL